MFQGNWTNTMWESGDQNIFTWLEKMSIIAQRWIIGLFFFNEASITANIYLHLLNEYVAPQLNDWQPNIIFQQDDASTHWGLHVRGFLNQAFPDWWIERYGPISWPLRLPHTTPLNFFLWGYVIDIVYRRNIRDITHLNQRNTNSIATIDEDMLHWT